MYMALLQRDLLMISTEHMNYVPSYICLPSKWEAPKG